MSAGREPHRIFPACWNRRVHGQAIVGWIGICLLVSQLAFAGDLRILEDQDTPNPSVKEAAKPLSIEPGPKDKRSPSVPEAPSSFNARENELLNLKVSEMRRLDQHVEQETDRMAAVVRMLDRYSASRWLEGFISERPWNCPIGKRRQWIDAIIDATELNGLPICKEILGLAACIVAIESGFRADPLAFDPSRSDTLADQMERAERELKQKMGPLFSMPPIPKLYAEYKDRYYSKLLACHTEGEIEQVARNIAADLEKDCSRLPDVLKKVVRKGVQKLRNVVRTKGSMQLNFVRACQVMKDRGEQFTDEDLVNYMYTTKGGVDVGLAALKQMFVQYAAYYATPDNLSWLFFVGMDYHYGPFSSRNMMEQIRVRDMSGRDIPLDGDLLRYIEEGNPVDEQSLTLQAAAAALPSVPQDSLLRAFLLEKEPHYIYTETHRLLAQIHREKFGETPFAVIGELWMGQESKIKHGTLWKTRSYLKRLDHYLNSVPWDD